MGKKRKPGALGLVIALVVVVFGGVLFMGAVSGWFSDNKVVLDEEYYCSESCEGEDFMSLTISEYEELIKEKKSFLVFIDQGGCTTADRLREYVSNYALEHGLKVYRMMFSEVKESSLHDQVKYYPSVAMVSRGNVISYLRADSDEDAILYNDYEAFKEWMGRYLVFKS